VKRGRFILELAMLVGLVCMGLLLWIAHTQVHAPFLPPYIFSQEQGSLRVEGSWAKEGDNAWPRETTTIECQAALHQCIEASAVFAVFPDNYLLFPVSINHLAIMRWDDDLVIVRGPGARCWDEVYEMHIKTQTVTGLQTKKAECSPDEPPARTRMIDGYKATQAARRRRDVSGD
jgi:hypothetical protein